MDIYNFSAGPAMLPRGVMQEIQTSIPNHNKIGASIIEVGHRSSTFIEVLDETERLLREITELPQNYKILFVHGGARMQFSAIPLNLIARSPTRKSCYVETGYFSKQAWEEGSRYSSAEVVATTVDTGFDRIPDSDSILWDDRAAYLHITSNNTVYGTRWNRFPKTDRVPLVIDATSEILSRRLDYSQFGLVYAGFQKNLGPAASALVLIREDLLGHALRETPLMLNYDTYAKSRSLHNTPNTFAIYVMSLILKWLKNLGGIAAIEALNAAKAQYLYDYLDSSGFYRGVARPEDRSTMNVTFHLREPELTDQFLKDSQDQGLLSLRGHRSVGGIRASIYNAMPIAGIETLVTFMREFERLYG